MGNLVKCADGGMAPAVIVCRHLLAGASRHAFAVPLVEGQDDPDLLCPECVVRIKELPPGDLVVLCLHCRRKLMGGGPDAPTWDEFNRMFDRLCALKKLSDTSGRPLDDLVDEEMNKRKQ
jgi:hypothetical protein